MIANLATTAIGIWLVYVAVLDPALMGSPFRFVAIVSGIFIVALSLVARRGDYHPWHSSVNIFLGIALVGIGVWSAVAPTAFIVDYWFMFWVGVLTSVIALWAALYRAATLDTNQRPAD